MKKVAVILLLLVFSGGCENVDRNMHDQVSLRVEKAENIPAPQGAVPVLGTAMRKDYSSIDGAELRPPYPLDIVASHRGKPMYDIYCSPCHGDNGMAETKTAKMMDIAPIDLTREATASLADGELFVKIVSGETGVMPKYRTELEDGEAWDVVAYLRTLQKK